MPGLDRPTRRSEMAAFSGLGLVAATLIGFAVFESARFAVEEDGIVATLSGEAQEPAQLATGSATNRRAMNLPDSWGRLPLGQPAFTPMRLGLP